MGKVYLAEDAMLARPVAIKFVAQLDAATRQRFLFEARAIAQIHHPNVVAIYRVGTLDSRPYLVTELVRGESLASAGKPKAWQAVLDIAIGLAHGLAAAHRRNVVHCDLKPGNVVIDADGVPKIIDFGLARIADAGRPTGAPVGTPDYMAPEVWLGEPPGRRADVYSFGALVFELLTGAPPFGDVEPAALRDRVTRDEAPGVRDRAPGVDAALADVVARCLRRDPAARFVDGDGLREALERLHASRRFAVRPGENPYRGLLPFDAGHRGLFFGRRSEIDAVVGRLRAESIVLVTGDSGVGKSSLCRAGVVPAVLELEGGSTWQSVSIVPGRRPLAAVASALGDPELATRLRETPAALARELRRHAPTGGLIVFIDQLEELITLGDPGEVAAFDAGLERLADDMPPGLRLLGTVRADFLSRIATLPGLGRDLSRFLYFLRPLPPERLRDVIVGPAAAVGARFESDAIVEDLVAATAQAGSGGLPLLSFALADLWEARDRKAEVISRDAVTAMGGVAGALSRHADVVIGGMIATDRSHARRILLRLITAMGTRARRSAAELALDDAARPALDALVRGRLVVVHDGELEPVYELAHDCLLSGWPTLRQWLDADSAGRAIRDRLGAAAAEWVRLSRRSDATWQGLRLAEAAVLDPESLGADDRAFLAASRRIGRWRWRLRWLAGLGVIGLLVLGYAIQRAVARRELDAEVDGELGRARRIHGHARDAVRIATELETWAFSVFDLGARDDGEAAWKYAVRQRELADRAYREASDAVEIAFARAPGRDDVRDLLGDLLLERAMLADHVRNLALRDELRDRLALYDPDDSRHRRWTAPGHVTVRAPAGAEITLEVGGAASTRRLGTGRAEVDLPPGSYVVVITAAGRVDVRAPILVERGRPVALALDPPPAARVPSGFVYIPAGEFLFGHANEDDRRTFFGTTPLRRRSTAAFLIARTEVTFDDWLVYVEAAPPDQQTARLPGASAVSGAVQLARDGVHWRIELHPVERSYVAGWGQPIVYADRDRRNTQDWRRFPVTGVSAEEAVAYTAWLAQTGQVPGARLCSEVEWERAARGADDRAYPGGRSPGQDDINVDDTYGLALRGPDEVGSHPASRSPFGLDDMSGNALEWTVSEFAQGVFILRSGSYWHDRKSAQVTNRTPLDAKHRDVAVGFRVCATPPLPD